MLMPDVYDVPNTAQEVVVEDDSVFGAEANSTSSSVPITNASCVLPYLLTLRKVAIAPTPSNRPTAFATSSGTIHSRPRDSSEPLSYKLKVCSNPPFLSHLFITIF